MTCCQTFDEMLDRGHARQAQLASLRDGRIVTEIDTDYFLVFGEDRPSYAGINYCPFCGRILSRGIWNLEKKKQ